MNKRPLGRSGLQIAPLVFGGNVFGWTVDQATAFTLLDRFIDAGLDTIDTADVYSTWLPANRAGSPEPTIANWPKPPLACREKTVLITKVARQLAPDGQVQIRRTPRLTSITKCPPRLPPLP